MRIVSARGVAAAVILWGLMAPSSLCALEPSEVMLVVNTATFDGEELAAYYMERRRIPKENIVRVRLLR